MTSEKASEKDKKVIPCDMLVIHGNGIVDESILTGESVPQVKESIQSWEDNEILDAKNKHKSHYLNGGTELVQVYQTDDFPNHLPKPSSNDNGLLCFVIRNGFGTK